MLELIVISTLNGVLFGMLLFLMASGLTVIFSMLGVLNFAHASFYMLGAFFGFQISRWFGFWPALLIAPLLAGALATVECVRRRRHGDQNQAAGEDQAGQGGGNSSKESMTQSRAPLSRPPSFEQQELFADR